MSVRPHWPGPAVPLPTPSRALSRVRSHSHVDPLRGASRQLAVWISRIASPPVIALLLLARIVDGTATPRAWAWAALFALPAVVAPALVVAALVRSGRIVDFDLSDRRQRHLPFAVATLCAAASTGVLAELGGPAALVAFGVAWSALLGVLSAVTARWKISLHGAAAGAAAALAGLGLVAGGTTAGDATTALWLALPLAVGWARVRLGRHTVRQAAAGTIVGIAAIVLATARF